MVRAAFNTIPILENLPLEISSAAAYGNRILIGSSNGTLLVYEIKELNDGHVQANLIETKKELSKKPIEKLQVIKEAGVLALLSDGIVTLYELNTLAKGTALKTTKGATTITAITAVELIEQVPTIIFKLVAVVKKKIITFEWRDSEYFESKEYICVDKIEAINFGSVHNIILATPKDFLSLQIPEGHWNELFSADASSLLTLGQETLNQFTNQDSASISTNLRQHAPQNQTEVSYGSRSSWSFGFADVLKATSFGAGVKKHPIIEKIENDELILCREKVGVYISRYGKISKKRNAVGAGPLVNFFQDPQCITHTSTYLINISSTKTPTSALDTLSQDPCGISSKSPNPNDPAPEEFCYCVEVRNIITHSLVQLIPLNCSVPNNDTILSIDSDTTGIYSLSHDQPQLMLKQNDGKRIWVVGKTTLWRLLPYPISYQVEEQLLFENFSEAESLVTQSDMILESEREELQLKIKWLQSLNLVRKPQLSETGFNMFLEIDATPTEAISAFPEYISGQLYNEENAIINTESEINTLDKPNATDTTANKQSQLHDGLRKDNGASGMPKEIHESSGEDKLTHLTDSDIPKNSINQENKDSNISKSKTPENELGPQKDQKPDSETDAQESQTIQNKTEKHENVIKKAPKESVRNLMRFLIEHRRILQKASANGENQVVYLVRTEPETGDNLEDSVLLNKFNNLDPKSLLNFKLDKIPINTSAMARLVDTTLLKVYLECAPSLVGSLVRVKNHCDVQESEKLLKESHKYKELVDFYFSKGLHRRALDLLLDRGKNSAEPSFSETVATVKYLQRLQPNNLDLILEYFIWPIQVALDSEKTSLQKSLIGNPGLTLDNDTQSSSKLAELDEPDEDNQDEQYKDPYFLIESVFMDERPVTKEFPRKVIAPYLFKFSPLLGISYLNWVIEMWKDTDQDIHDLYALYLIKNETETKRISTSYLPTKSKGINRYQKIIQIKLYPFLRTSNYYTPEKVLASLPSNSLYSERAVVLGRLGQHTQGLAVLVENVKSDANFEEYCLDNVENEPLIFVELVRALVKNQPSSPSVNSENGVNYQKSWNFIKMMETLTKYPTFLPVNLLLPLLFEKTLINKDILSYLKVQFYSNISREKNSRIGLSLCKSESYRLNGMLIEHQKNRVILNKSRVCGICMKRLILDSAFVVLPISTYESVLKSQEKTREKSIERSEVQKQKTERRSFYNESLDFLYASEYSHPEKSYDHSTGFEFKSDNHNTGLDSRNSDSIIEKKPIQLPILKPSFTKENIAFDKYLQDARLESSTNLTSNIKLIHYSCWQRYSGANFKRN